MLESDPSSSPRFRPGISLVHKLASTWLLTDPNYLVGSNRPNMKNYQVQNHMDMRVWYLCGGRLRTLKKAPLHLAVALLMAVSAVLYFIYEADWTWHNLSPGVVIVFAYLWFLTAAFFIKAATLDPGTQPRNLHIPYNLTFLHQGNGPDEYFNTVTLPYITDRENGVSVKYCATCHIWRAPRTSHCGVCNACVLNHDHHCIFLNNCVGYRNYRYFLWFLTLAVLVSVYLAVFSFIHCMWFRQHTVLYKGEAVTSFHVSIRNSPVPFLLALIGCLGAVYPFMLLVFHFFLTAHNLTTREYLNYVRPLAGSDETYVNVFDRHSVFQNLWLRWVAAPLGISFLRPTEAYEEGDFSKEGLPALQAFAK